MPKLKEEMPVKIIEKMCNMIEEEIHDAEKYIRCALNYKDDKDMRDVAELFYRLATEEMNHMNMLHTQVVSLIDNYRKTEGEPPKEMLMLYDILHRKHIDDAATVKAMINMYKGQ